MERVLLRKRGFHLVAADPSAETELGHIKDGQTVYVEIRRARNPRQHALYWALIGKLFEHQEACPTRAQYSDKIKCAVGHCDVTDLGSGRLMMVPKSISFANMPQSEFEQFFAKVVELVTTKIWPHLTNEELRQEIDAMVNPREYA